MESSANRHSATSIFEGAHWQKKYSLLVCITTGRDEWVLEPYVWGEDLLKDLYFVAEAHKARECPLMNP